MECYETCLKRGMAWSGKGLPSDEIAEILGKLIPGK